MPFGPETGARRRLVVVVHVATAARWPARPVVCHRRDRDRDPLDGPNGIEGPPCGSDFCRRLGQAAERRHVGIGPESERRTDWPLAFTGPPPPPAAAGARAGILVMLFIVVTQLASSARCQRRGSISAFVAGALRTPCFASRNGPPCGDSPRAQGPPSTSGAFLRR